MGFSRQESWSGLPFPSPGDLPDPGIELSSSTSPALADHSFTTEPPRKYKATYIISNTPGMAAVGTDSALLSRICGFQPPEQFRWIIQGSGPSNRGSSASELRRITWQVPAGTAQNTTFSWTSQCIPWPRHLPWKPGLEKRNMDTGHLSRWHLLFSACHIICHFHMGHWQLSVRQDLPCHRQISRQTEKETNASLS